ncbi:MULTISPECIES: helix-turn-helix transcriptional regulator [unclassified Lactobacillus]|nr:MULTISPECIES: helix-turn-helix transcriptional regulator [unclassified Lactobacillus]
MSNYKVPNNVKHTIKDLRVRAGLSQWEAAEALNISRTTLQTWEKDATKLSIRDISIIAALYKIPTDYIFFGPNNAFSVKKQMEGNNHGIN